MAGIQLHPDLVRPDINLDPRPSTGEGRDDGVPESAGRGDGPAVVVPRAAGGGAAVADPLGGGLVGAELLGLGPEVVDGALFDAGDLTRRDHVWVRLEEGLGEGGVVVVVPDEVGGGVGEGVEVPVGVLGEEEGWKYMLADGYEMVW